MLSTGTITVRSEMVGGIKIGWLSKVGIVGGINIGCANEHPKHPILIPPIATPNINPIFTVVQIQ